MSNPKMSIPLADTPPVGLPGLEEEEVGEGERPRRGEDEEAP